MPLPDHRITIAKILIILIAAKRRIDELKELDALLAVAEEARWAEIGVLKTAISLDEEGWQDQSSLPLWAQKHRTIKAIAERWGMGVDTTRELFEDEPDLIELNRHETLNKRGYTTRFIPAVVISRVHARLVTRKKRLAAQR